MAQAAGAPPNAGRTSRPTSGSTAKRRNAERAAAAMNGAAATTDGAAAATDGAPRAAPLMGQAARSSSVEPVGSAPVGSAPLDGVGLLVGLGDFVALGDAVGFGDGLVDGSGAESASSG